MSLVDMTDHSVIPTLTLLADWSIRWGLLLAMLWILLALRRPRRAAMRYLLCVGALGAGLLLPAAPRSGTATIAWASWKPRHAIDSSRVPSDRPLEFTRAVPSAPTTISTTIVPARPAVPQRLNGEPPIRAATLPRPAIGMWRLIALGIGAAWASVAVILCAQLIGGRLLVSRLRNGVAEADPGSLRLLDACRRELGLTRPVGMAVHRAVASPVTLGGRAALVVVPPDWRDWSLVDRRACLFHELTHLANRDDWVKLVQEIVRIPFFFHPLVNWVLSRLDRERELLCDESVIARGTDPVGYAQLLFDLAQRPGRLLPLTRPRCTGWLPFLDRGTISDRIQRLLEVDMERDVSTSGITTRGIVLAGVATILLAVGVGGIRVRGGESRSVKEAAKDVDVLSPQRKAEDSNAKAPAISGVVLDPELAPVAGAVVVVGIDSDDPHHAPQASKTDKHILQTDGNGRFGCPVPPGSGLIALYAFKAGLAPVAWLSWRDAGKEISPVELRLSKPQPFRAKLVDRQGKPVSGADVRITRLATGPTVVGTTRGGGQTVSVRYETIRWDVISGSPLAALYAAKSDAEGTVVFPALREGGGVKFDVIAPGGSGVLRVSRDGLRGPQQLIDESFVPRADLGPALVTLIPAARVSGRVVTKLPGVSVAGLSVSLQSGTRSSPFQSADATTDPQGRFVIGRLDEGTANIMLGDRNPEVPWTYRAAENVPLRAGETAEVTIELIRGVEVEGRVVVQRTNQPVEKAQVGVYGPYRPKSGEATQSVVTDAQGRYRFRLPAGEAYLYVCGPPSGYTRLANGGSSTTVTLPDGVTRFEAPPIELAAAVTLKGRVLDAAGAAVQGVHVVGTCVGGVCQPFPGSDAVTDALGEFRLPSGGFNTIPIGQVARLLIRMGDGTEYESAALPAADGSVTVKLAVLQQKPPQVRGPRDVAPQDLAGIVVDAAGDPIEGVEVDAWTWYPGNETRTDSRGWFRLLNLGKDEKVEILFRKPGYTPRLFLAQPTGTKDWVIVLGDKTYFEGKVTGPDGRPVLDALIRANRGPKSPQPGYMITDIWTETKSRTGGLYRLYAEADVYEIQVAVPGVGVARLPNQVLATDDAKRLDIRLKGGVTFRGKVVDSLTHQPISGVRLWHWQHREVEGKSGKNGTVTIADMMPGRFAFQVDAPGYARWWSEQAATEWARFQILHDRGGWQRNFDHIDFDLTSGMEPVTITLERAVKITGRVLDPDGKPVAGATVAPALTGTGNSLTGDTRFSVQTDKDGQFTMTLPASGGRQYNLVAHDGKYQQWRNWANGVLPPIGTKPGQEIRGVELRLTKPATVRGRVRDVDGQPVANREVRAAAADLLENRYYDPTVSTAADGTFELKFIRPGEQAIQVAPFWLDPRQAPVGTNQTLTLKPGEMKEGVEFRIPANAR